MRSWKGRSRPRIPAGATIFPDIADTDRDGFSQRSDRLAA
jgi:hypothetical protein